MAPPRIYCCSNGCLNSSIKRPEMSYFKLPKEIERRREWLRLISREDLEDKMAKSYVVCEEHFHAHQILRAEHRKNLKKNAIPSLNLPDMPREVIAFTLKLNLDATTQTEENNLANKLNSRKRKLKPKLKQNKQNKQIKLDVDTQSRKQQKEVFKKLCDKFLNNEFSELVKTHALTVSKSKKKKYFPATTKVSDQTMAFLKVKVDHMTEEEKNCAIIVDTLDLKANLVYNIKEDKIIGFHEVDGIQTPEPATAAMVLMLRGIVVDWKQAVGFALLSEYRNYEEITKWIDKLVGMLLDMGLNIRTFVSDMRTDVYNLAIKRPFSTERPFYSHRRKKMFYIYDTPYLIKLFRDSFLVNEFNFRGCVANCQPIQQFYNQDSEKSCSLAPKLTRIHLNPSGDEKDDFSLAVQLLSNTVASAILTYIDFYVIDESGRDTVKVIKLINDLFDLLNSVNLKDNNVFKKAFCGDPAQIQLFNDAINFFRTVKLVDSNGRDVTSSAKFIEGFQVTISSVMLLLEDLGRKGITVLRTRRLNKSEIEKFFKQIKSINGITDDPSSRQFMIGYRELFVKDLMKPTSGKDCSMELAKLLTANCSSDVSDDVGEENEINSSRIVESKNNVNIESSEYNKIEIPDEVVYFSSYLLKRCSEKHKGCEILNSYISPTLEQRVHNFSGDKRYQRYRDYSKKTCSSLLIVPNDDFIKYVEKMEDEIRISFRKKHVFKDIAATIYKEICELCYTPPCPCFPSEYMKKLYIRMRIFHTIQYNNKQLRIGGSKRRYFTVPDL